MKLTCLQCKKFFNIYPYEKGRAKYCSKKCQFQSVSFRKKLREANLGKIYSEKSRLKMSQTKKELYAKGIIQVWNKGKKYTQITGIKNPMWKGDKVGYDALHDWVNRHLGKANLCEHCGKRGLGRQIHWANKSRKYYRKLNDWLSLCAKCHKKYDRIQN